jgi:hypothetical protein
MLCVLAATTAHAQVVNGSITGTVSDTSGGVLTNVEAAGVLRAGFQRAGQKRKLDMIFSDTCLNGMVEVLDQLEPFATVVVGSEELEPGDGWDYQGLYRAMSGRPPSSAVAWAPPLENLDGLISMTGGMLIGTLIDELHRTGGKYGLATLCVGGGMGIATVVEAI